MSGRRRQQDEAAPDEYQAPFTLPSKSKAIQQPKDQDGHDESEMASSPFFDDKEHAEALAWARSEQAVDDGEEEDSSSGAVAIGGGRRRRDSQVSSYGDVGSVFDGPNAGAVPSSVSSMRHAMTRPELSRKASSRARRRISRDGYSRGRSYGEDGDSQVDGHEAGSMHSGRPSSVRSSGDHSARIGRRRRDRKSVV